MSPNPLNDSTPQKQVSVTFNLYDDASVHEKLTVMTKLEAVFDDERNPDIHTTLDDFLQLGYSYEFTLRELPHDPTVEPVTERGDR
jgi:hypothetical protein